MTINTFIEKNNYLPNCCSSDDNLESPYQCGYCAELDNEDNVIFRKSEFEKNIRITGTGYYGNQLGRLAPSVLNLNISYMQDYPDGTGIACRKCNSINGNYKLYINNENFRKPKITNDIYSYNTDELYRHLHVDGNYVYKKQKDIINTCYWSTYLCNTAGNLFDYCGISKIQASLSTGISSGIYLNIEFFNARTDVTNYFYSNQYFHNNDVDSLGFGINSHNVIVYKKRIGWISNEGYSDLRCLNISENLSQSDIYYVGGSDRCDTTNCIISIEGSNTNNDKINVLNNHSITFNYKANEHSRTDLYDTYSSVTVSGIKHFDFNDVNFTENIIDNETQLTYNFDIQPKVYKVTFSGINNSNCIFCDLLNTEHYLSMSASDTGPYYDNKNSIFNKHGGNGPSYFKHFIKTNHNYFNEDYEQLCCTCASGDLCVGSLALSFDHINNKIFLDLFSGKYYDNNNGDTYYNIPVPRLDVSFMFNSYSKPNRNLYISQEPDNIYDYINQQSCDFNNVSIIIEPATLNNNDYTFPCFEQVKRCEACVNYDVPENVLVNIPDNWYPTANKSLPEQREDVCFPTIPRSIYKIVPACGDCGIAGTQTMPIGDFILNRLKVSIVDSELNSKKPFLIHRNEDGELYATVAEEYDVGCIWYYENPDRLSTYGFNKYPFKYHWPAFTYRFYSAGLFSNKDNSNCDECNLSFETVTPETDICGWSCMFLWYKNGILSLYILSGEASKIENTIYSGGPHPKYIGGEWSRLLGDSSDDKIPDAINYWNGGSLSLSTNHSNEYYHIFSKSINVSDCVNWSNFELSYNVPVGRYNKFSHSDVETKHNPLMWTWGRNTIQENLDKLSIDGCGVNSPYYELLYSCPSYVSSVGDVNEVITITAL